MKKACRKESPFNSRSERGQKATAGGSPTLTRNDAHLPARRVAVDDRLRGVDGLGVTKDGEVGSKLAKLQFMVCCM